MDGLLSVNSHKSNEADLVESSRTAAHKRQKPSSDSPWEQNRLFPSLPVEISVQILARLSRISYFNAKLVSGRWKAVITIPELYRCRKELGTTAEWLYILTKSEDDKLMWYALDPISKTWQRLPPMPTIPAEDGPRRSLLRLWEWNVVDFSTISDAIRRWPGNRGALDQVTL